MSQNREEAHLPELVDAELEAVTGGTSDEAIAMASLSAQAKQYELMAKLAAQAIESAGEGMKKVANP